MRQQLACHLTLAPWATGGHPSLTPTYKSLVWALFSHVRLSCPCDLCNAKREKQKKTATSEKNSGTVFHLGLGFLVCLFVCLLAQCLGQVRRLFTKARMQSIQPSGRGVVHVVLASSRGYGGRLTGPC